MDLAKNIPGSSPLSQGLSLVQEGMTGSLPWGAGAITGGKETSEEHSVAWN